MERWKKGIEGITPLQQTKTSLMGVHIVLAGIFWGIVVIAIAQIWWLFVILIGSLIVTITQWIGTYQKYKKFKAVEEVMAGLKGGKE
jgi:hypothetical protein